MGYINKCKFGRSALLDQIKRTLEALTKKEYSSNSKIIKVVSFVLNLSFLKLDLGETLDKDLELRLKIYKVYYTLYGMYPYYILYNNENWKLDIIEYYQKDSNPTLLLRLCNDNGDMLGIDHNHEVSIKRKEADEKDTWNWKRIARRIKSFK